MGTQDLQCVSVRDIYDRERQTLELMFVTFQFGLK